MTSLVKQAYSLTALRNEELQGAKILSVIRQMNERFSGRLGIGQSEVKKGAR